MLQPHGFLKYSKLYPYIFSSLILIITCFLILGCGGYSGSNTNHESDRIDSEEDEGDDSDDHDYYQTKTLTGLSIGGPNSVNESDNSNYTAAATFSDGTSQIVTDEVIWSEDSPYVNMDAHGVLAVLEVSGNHIVTIKATYTYGEEIKTATRAITIIDIPEEPEISSHEGRFAAYEGTRTCLACHTDKAYEVHSSVHYQWKGDASDALDIGSGEAGKLDGINDFCIYPNINWLGKMVNLDGLEVDGGCARCHAGLGERPDSMVSQAQLENIDCLICHSSSYQRKVEKVGEVFQFTPDTDKMPVSILQASLDLNLPSSGNCLNCHAFAGGGNNFKRGDLEDAHRNPSREFDVHMASISDGGAGLSCLSCHTAADHRIAGRGSDLLPRDSLEEVSCTNCHSSAPHRNLNIDKHTKRVSRIFHRGSRGACRG